MKIKLLNIGLIITFIIKNTDSMNINIQMLLNDTNTGKKIISLLSKEDIANLIDAFPNIYPNTAINSDENTNNKKDSNEYLRKLESTAPTDYKSNQLSFMPIEVLLNIIEYLEDKEDIYNFLDAYINQNSISLSKFQETFPHIMAKINPISCYYLKNNLIIQSMLLNCINKIFDDNPELFLNIINNLITYYDSDFSCRIIGDIVKRIGVIDFNNNTIIKVLLYLDGIRYKELTNYILDNGQNFDIHNISRNIHTFGDLVSFLQSCFSNAKYKKLLQENALQYIFALVDNNSNIKKYKKSDKQTFYSDKYISAIYSFTGKFKLHNIIRYSKNFNTDISEALKNITRIDFNNKLIIKSFIALCEKQYADYIAHFILRGLNFDYSARYTEIALNVLIKTDKYNNLVNNLIDNMHQLSLTTLSWTKEQLNYFKKILKESSSNEIYKFLNISRKFNIQDIEETSHLLIIAASQRDIDILNSLITHGAKLSRYHKNLDIIFAVLTNANKIEAIEILKNNLI